MRDGPVVVVGAGLGGLSAACHLAGRGHERGVVEARRPSRGSSRILEQGGYRFDTGPTVLTMPHLIERCFDAARRRHGRLLHAAAVDPMYRACFADGSELRVRHGRDAMAEEIRDVCGAGRGRELRSVLRLADPALRASRCPTSSTATTTARSTWCDRSPRRSSSLRLGGFRRLAADGRALLRTTSGCSGSSASSRCMPGWRRTRRSRSTPSSPTWTP